jgi:hypothetical protein
VRLRRVATGHTFITKMKLLLIRIQGDLDDIVRTLLYRPESFGRPYSIALHQALRGPSEWSVGERELFAAFVSRVNSCPF